MDTPGGLVGELIEKGQNAATTNAKNAVSDVTQSVGNQVGLGNKPTATQQLSQAPNPQQAEPVQPSQDQASNERTTEMVRDFYAPSTDLPQNTLQQQEKIDTDQQLAQVRQKLHQELHNEVYFNDLNNPKKKEERVADKVEREEKEAMQDLQVQEAKKPDNTALIRAQTVTERSPGVAG